MKKIAIIGAGISGLYIANLFRLNPDYEITIYEKNDSINLEKGYGIQLSVNSIKLLNKIGFNNINLKEKFFPNTIDFYSLKNKNKICNLNISIDFLYTKNKPKNGIWIEKTKLANHLIPTFTKKIFASVKHNL